MPVYATGRTGGTSKGVSINTVNKSVSEYLNYPFNSFATLGDKMLGADENGLYLLEGDDDDGSPIAATFRLALQDFKTSLLKRLIMCYVGIKFIGQINIKTVDEAESLGAARPMTSIVDKKQRLRVKFARGPRNSYWAVDISNNAGEDFNLDMVELEAVPTGRRIG
jgi:hypothetical protein